MRYISIDILRTIAIFLMVIVHFVENLSGSTFVPSGFGAPLFTLLVGVSYSLWLTAQEKRGREDAEISKITVRRGLFLLGVGFLFNIVVWLPEDTYNWDVLTFIGAAILALNLVRKLPAIVSILACVLVLIFSPLLRAVTEYNTYWTNGYFDPDMKLSDVLLGFMVNGFFPFFPWIIYPVVGFWVGQWLFSAGERAPATLRRLAVLGLTLLVASIAAMYLRSYVPTKIQSVWLIKWTQFPASTEYLLGTLGVALTALALMHAWIDRNPRIAKDGRLARIAATYSSHSFTIYILHHVAHLWPMWIYALTQGATDPTQYWRNAVPIAWAWPLALAFLLLCYGLMRWIEYARIPSIENWMRWVCD